MPTVVVQQGDCIASIAAEHGFLISAIWDHGENAELKALRKDPMILYEGDRVFVPEREEKSVDAASGQSHRFVCKSAAPTYLEVRFVNFLGDPRANEAYVIDVDGALRPQRHTDGDGWLREPVSATAQSARVLFTGESETEATWLEIDMGQLDPIDTVVGAQQRLHNLHFLQAEPSGEIDAPTRRALKRFQKAHELDRSGEIDGATRAKLLEVHGC